MRIKYRNTTPEAYFERSWFFLLIFYSLTVGCLIGYFFLFKYLAFEQYYLVILLFTPVFFLAVNALYVLFNPLVIVYSDYMEFCFFLFLKKAYYFQDIKDLRFISDTRLELIYRDDERELLRFFPIRPSQKKDFVNAVYKKILEME
ncbi:MAG: hypothetical protein N3F09_00615 [Bacteroidia bacterium]|nr:hypothetical protein [Bacteroidia bacterium]